MAVTGRVFICHASADVALAQEVVAGLEAAGVACWISARDVGAGRNFQEAIVQAIRDARAVVFLLSAASNRSEEVRKELALASSFAVAVLPVRLGAAEPVAALRYELATRQWIEGGEAGAGAGVVAALLAALGEGADVATAAQAAVAGSDRPSLVVLPFQNMSGDAEQEYFADGMVDDITSALSRIGWLLVMGRNTAFTYKGRGVDSRQVGRELGVRYVLEGSVRKAGGRVRITCQLIEAAGGHQIWTERFDGDLADIFDMQDRVTESVVGAIEPSLRVAEIARAAAKPTGSLDAYDLFLRALPLHSARTRESLETAIGLLRQALAIDPGYVRAKAWLGLFYSARVLRGLAAPGDREAAIGLARDVVASGTDDPEALRYASDPLTLLAGDHPAALAALHRALRLHPNSAGVLNALGHVHCFANDPAPAIAYLERAIRLSPLDPLIGYALFGLGRAHLMLGHDDEAVSFLQRCVPELRANDMGRRFLIQALTRVGRHAEARAEAAALLALWPDFSSGRVWRVLHPNLYNPAFVAEHLRALLAAGLPE